MAINKGVKHVPVQARSPNNRYVQSKPRNINDKFVELSADGFIFAAEIAKRATKAPSY